MQVAAFLENLIAAGAVVFSIEANRNHRLPDVQIAQRNFWQPRRQVRVNEERMQWSVRIESEQRIGPA